MLPVLILRAKYKGESSYPSTIPMMPWYNYFIPLLQGTRSKEKSSAGMLSYPEEI